ncbi:hypothetical protein Tco_1009391 [Tanacetum coccineum]
MPSSPRRHYHHLHSHVTTTAFAPPSSRHRHPLTTDENGVEDEVPPKTAQALLQRQRERKAKIILLLAIPDEYQLRFHGIKDAKSLWAAIKSRFGGNVESKKMQKNVLKQQFENFFVSDTEGLDKAYDRFQKLISLLEVHGAAVPNEDANQKFLRENKDGIDDLDIDDLYNNLKVFEADIKGSSGSSLNSQNVAFLSTEDTSSSNEVNTANGVSYSAFSHNLKGSKPLHRHILMINKLTINGQWSMLSNESLSDFNKKLGRQLNLNGKEPVGYRSRDNTRRTIPVETSDALGCFKNNLRLSKFGLGYD